MPDALRAAKKAAFSQARSTADLAGLMDILNGRPAAAWPHFQPGVHSDHATLRARLLDLAGIAQHWAVNSWVDGALDVGEFLRPFVAVAPIGNEPAAAARDRSALAIAMRSLFNLFIFDRVARGYLVIAVCGRSRCAEWFVLSSARPKYCSPRCAKVGAAENDNSRALARLAKAVKGR